MKEADFLNTLVAISVIGKNVKQELENCLNLRDGCGHPNSLRIGEVLRLNLIDPIHTTLAEILQRFRKLRMRAAVS